MVPEWEDPMVPEWEEPMVPELFSPFLSSPNILKLLDQKQQHSYI